MLCVKALTIFAVTLAASTTAIVYTDGVGWAFAIAGITAIAGARAQFVADCALLHVKAARVVALLRSLER
jgi:predicted ABC-type sugar transport system permease subunit